MLQYLVSIGTLAAITALLTLGLNSRWGLGGELDLGYYLFVALGAYVDGVLTLPAASTQPGVHYILGLNLPFVVGFLGAGIVTGVLSLAIGSVALRNLRAEYFAIVTVATTIIGYTVISQYTPLFNGYNGLYGASQPFEGVLHLGPQPYQTFYFGLCVVILAAVFVILELIRRSPFGRAVKSVREDEVAAAAYGRNPYRLRLKAYVIGGVVAGGDFPALWRAPGRRDSQQLRRRGRGGNSAGRVSAADPAHTGLRQQLERGPGGAGHRHRAAHHRGPAVPPGRPPAGAEDHERAVAHRRIVELARPPCGRVGRELTWWPAQR